MANLNVICVCGCSAVGMLGGIRHLIWDTIHGLEPAEREMLTLATLIGSIALTLILWVVGYLVMGGPR